MGVFQTLGECICGMLFHLTERPFDCVLSEYKLNRHMLQPFLCIKHTVASIQLVFMSLE